MMLAGLFGPRAFVVAVLLGLAGTGALGYLLLDAREAQGAAESRARLAEGANQVWQQAWANQQSRLQQHDRLLAEILDGLDEARQATADSLNRYQGELLDAIQTDDYTARWASADLPAVVVRRLCEQDAFDAATRNRVCVTPSAAGPGGDAAGNGHGQQGPGPVEPGADR